VRSVVVRAGQRAGVAPEAPKLGAAFLAAAVTASMLMVVPGEAAAASSGGRAGASKFSARRRAITRQVRKSCQQSSVWIACMQYSVLVLGFRAPRHWSFCFCCYCQDRVSRDPAWTAQHTTAEQLHFLYRAECNHADTMLTRLCSLPCCCTCSDPAPSQVNSYSSTTIIAAPPVLAPPVVVAPPPPFGISIVPVIPIPLPNPFASPAPAPVAASTVAAEAAAASASAEAAAAAATAAAAAATAAAAVAAAK
jgi:hypothetical protein